LTPIAFPEETTTFFLTATNGVCERTDEMVVTVNKNLTIPTVFSPNGDGINDRWEILGTARFPNMKMEMMDRWGQKVFETVGTTSKNGGTVRIGENLWLPLRIIM
jgi:gliding motility-associated-like protein